MSTRKADGFRQALRGLATPRTGDGGATPLVVDLTFRASLGWPEKHWYDPENAREVAHQAAVRSRRKQGLGVVVQNDPVLTRLATLFRS